MTDFVSVEPLASGWQDAEIVFFPDGPAVSDPQLHQVARLLAGDAYADVRINADNPVTKYSEWRVFHRFPVVTRTMTSVWRMMAARSFDDLADELREGSAHPRTIGEHVALSLVISDCGHAIDSSDLGALRGSLLDSGLVDALYDPASPQARSIGEDPDLWFRPLIDGLERDPSRGFRGWQ
ncbi:hypothetical protein M2272_003987 [Mycobacterium frederiksbergense]|uniref:DUF4265 domain-containing protein n=1 Tax=Mycolicibacterium frederiksbergense TaxID=117567 RepID=A0ABT6L323_9MYCO|nr:hypothetical protein [Mycolicibacterium frederiksbergense]MDH6197334.1 hypothetical protein [Mycolicibacterium frederiksbergense]